MLAFDNLMEAPLKLALGACMKQNIAQFSESQIILKFPALEGLIGERDPAFWGAPPPNEWSEILSQCLTPLAED